MTGDAPPLLVTISGPSGVGKDSLMRALAESDPRLERVVTATSRPPRSDEEDGVAYFFLTKNEFERRVATGDFVEHAEVHGDYKGVLKAELERILRDGRDPLLQVDVQGAATIRSLIPQALTIFVKPESMEALIERRKRRGSMSDEEAERRAQDAHDELARADEFDHVVINKTGDLSDSVEEVARIIAEERSRSGREAPSLPA
ncbi:MAG TPA: guanylate kinase [Dehalococcoidia bacterium]|nr:guanylate kinase [Dehalococcoidia bacterium]